MKTILFRSCMILLAAGLVCGALFLYADGAGSSAGNGNGTGANRQAAFPDAQSENQAALQGSGGGLGMGRGGHDRRASDSPFAALGLLVQAAKISLVTLIVVGIQRLAHRLGHHKTGPATA